MTITDSLKIAFTMTVKQIHKIISRRFFTSHKIFKILDRAALITFHREEPGSHRMYIE